LLQSTLDTIDHGIAVSMRPPAGGLEPSLLRTAGLAPRSGPGGDPTGCPAQDEPDHGAPVPSAFGPLARISRFERPSLQGGSWSWRASRCPMAAL
jgi:hypothetical protein